MCAMNVCDETARQTDVCPLLYVPLSLYIFGLLRWDER